MDREALQISGYQEIRYNGGVIIGFRKPFGRVKDARNIRASYCEVRYNEIPDSEAIAYLIFPNLMVPLPGLKTVTELEALRELLDKGSRA